MSAPGGRIALYLHSARHLKRSQLARQLLRRIRGANPAPASVSANLRGLDQSVIRGWQLDGAARSARAADVLAGRLTFLNRTLPIAATDWVSAADGRLWEYNRHYFDYALDVAASAGADGAGWFAQAACAWIDAHPGRTGDAWDPYPVSLRTVNWIYARLLFGDALDPVAAQRIDASIAQQLSHLERNLEYHVLANHLQKNLKALVVGGLYFRGEAADRWLKRGTKELWRELFEQVLPDGVQYERSPMYHAIALGDFLEVIDLFRAAGRVVRPQVMARVRKMAEAMAVLSRPDGTLHLFNDAADGIAPDRAWLDHMSRLVLDSPIPDLQGHAVLAGAGYHAWIDAARGERLVVDCGAPGPSYQPGHAHCDLLSFELDLGGVPFVVDSGVHGYDGDPYREYVRSTRAHNTVVIGGREQSEVWATFRMARRARVLHGESDAPAGHFHFRGAYRPFHSRCAHHRTIEKLGGWRISDRLDGAQGESLESWIHLHPGCTAAIDGCRILVQRPQGEVVIEPFGADAHSIVQGELLPAPQGWYCPEFGKALPAPAIRLLVHANDGREFGYTITEVKR